MNSMRLFLLLVAFGMLLAQMPLFAQPKPQNAEQARDAEDEIDNVLRQFGEENSGLRAKIDAAIEKGANWLLSKQQPDGHFDCYDAYPMGGTALCALALKKCMVGWYEGSDKDLQREISALQAKEKSNKITYAEMLRLKYLQNTAPGEIQKRVKFQAAVDKALVWLRAKYKELKTQQMIFKNINGPQSNFRIYDLGVTLMLLEGYYTERKKTADGYVFAVEPRKVPATDLDWVKEMVDWIGGKLLTPNIDGKDYAGKAWRYPGGASNDNSTVDNSNSQYAALGLKAASRMGVQVKDNEAWRKVCEYFISTQEADGPEVRRANAKIEGGKYTYAGEGQADKARGWSYFPRPDASHPVSGAMTTAALAALITAKSALYEAKVLPRDKDLEAKIDKAIADGSAWLALNFSVEVNPTGKANMRVGWDYYYLYGLERAGVLCQVEAFGKHPWYVEGAKFLCGKQSAEGWWNSQSNPDKGGSVDAERMGDTSFALLFLKRATTPIKVQVPRPVITGEK